MSEQEILDSSRLLFAKYGYDYVSVRKIASEANVNIGSISYYFHNKIGILHRIVDQYYAGLSESLYPILDGPILNKKDAIRTLAKNAIEYMYSNIDSSRIVMREITLETERFDEVIKPHYISFNNKLIAFFERMGIKNPSNSAIKFMALTRFPFSNVNVVELYYQRPFSPELVDELIEMVLSSFSSELSA